MRALLCLLLAAAPAAAQSPPPATSAQAPPPDAAPAVPQSSLEAEGAAALGLALRSLGTTARVLMIGAHPDDENTALLAELALGRGADAAYLSLTRGEGGQNLIGPELQEGLGLIRSEELLAARRLDGAVQFFTRAYDYGFSKSADEAFAQWPRDSLLADIVAVIRRYRPDIVVSIFSGTPADGHGQHQAAGLLARDAFAAAGDPTRFPGQIAGGLRPHTPAYLFQSMYRPPADPPLVVETGELDPLFGRSRYQIAMRSRSRHRSQDMGRAQPPGPHATALRVLAGAHPAGGDDVANGGRAAGSRTSLFTALDTTPVQHARSAGAPREVVDALKSYEHDVAHIRSSYNPLAAHDLAPALATATLRLDRALEQIRDDAAFADLRFTLEREREDAARALRLAAGVVIDVVADDPLLVPGQSFPLTLTLWNGGRAPLDVSALEPDLPRGWHAEVAGDSHPSGRPGAVTLEPGAVLRRRFHITVPPDAAPTEPYFLRQPRRGAVYRWPENGVRGLPFAPALVRARADLRVAGARVRAVSEAEYVEVDKAVGEVRRPLLIVPAVSVHVEPATIVLPQRPGDSGADRQRTISVHVDTEARDGATGTVRLEAPAGWRVEPATANVALRRAGESRTVRFTVTPPADLRAGATELKAAFTDGERTFTRGYEVIDYPHTRPRALYRDAVVRLTAFPVRIAEDIRVGYIEGAGDDGAEALRQLGARVEILSPAALAGGDLSRYDAIVAGIRAYEVRLDLVAHNDRLLEYAREGGAFIVQYNKYELADGRFLPYAATMARPHGRVTDENARVTLLDPRHPVLSFPNRITGDDFAGWVQERGLYFLDTFDDRYTPLLAMADPGEDAQTGALVAARLGDGWYVYTGLSLFRQLPAGVPGAYRILANLVSLGRAPAAR